VVCQQIAGDVAKRLGDVKIQGSLVMGAPVYAELLANPKATEAFINKFISDTGIVVDFGLDQEV